MDTLFVIFFFNMVPLQSANLRQALLSLMLLLLLTSSVMLIFSVTSSTNVLRIKNLSLHFTSKGGSSLCPWSMTRCLHKYTEIQAIYHQHLLCTSIVPLGGITSEFGRTQYNLGAVVLTLKATGLSLGF